MKIQKGIVCMKYLLLCLSLVFFVGCAEANNNTDKTKFESLKEYCMQLGFLNSKKMIDFILQDLEKSYDHLGGGGISEIKQTYTNVYEVSILQEERVDVFTYEMNINEQCDVSIESKRASAITAGS